MNGQEEGYGRGRWVCRVDYGTADCRYGAGGRGVDGYFGGSAGGENAGHDGVCTHYRGGRAGDRRFDGQRGLQRDGGQRRGGDYGGVSAEAGHEPRRFAE